MNRHQGNDVTHQPVSLPAAVSLQCNWWGGEGITPFRGANTGARCWERANEAITQVRLDSVCWVRSAIGLPQSSRMINDEQGAGSGRTPARFWRIISGSASPQWCDSFHTKLKHTSSLLTAFFCFNPLRPRALKGEAFMSCIGSEQLKRLFKAFWPQQKKNIWFDLISKPVISFAANHLLFFFCYQQQKHIYIQE